MDKKKIYNPQSNETLNERRTIGGNPDGMINFTKCKYEWASKLWDQMEANTWFPREVQMTSDAKDYKYLLPEEKRMYDLVLSQLIFMDSLQTNNLMDNINPYITAPEINAILSRQSYEEANHSKSYAVMVESISDNTDLIYDMWKTDKVLKMKNSHIAETYDNLSGIITNKKIVLAMFANQILEGLYFYSGFAAIYALGKSGKMQGSSQMIKFIQRDEVCLHPDTQILTSDGWKYIEFVTTDDMVAQYDMNDESITFDKPVAKIWKKYDGDMYRIIDARGKAVQNITKGHEIVTKMTKTNNIIKEKIENSKFHGFKHIPCSGYGSGDKKNLSAFERLLIAISADGSLDKKRYGIISGHQVVHFGVKKNRKKERILKLLKDSNIPYKIHDTDRCDYLSLYVMIDRNKKLDKEFKWVDLSKISSEWCREFMDELVRWDGHIANDRDSLYYSSARKDEFDKVLCVCSMAGYKFKTSVQKDDRSDNYSDIYRLVWWKHTNALDTQSMIKEMYNYNGNVGCVTMPKGTIITKHDNQVSITGNCHLLLFQNLINSTRKERPELFDADLEKEVRSMFRKAVELESNWGTYITQGKILGFTDAIILQYIQYLADMRLKAVGYEPEYGVKHPIPWVDGYASFNDQRTNFFEGNVINYSKGSITFEDF